MFVHGFKHLRPLQSRGEIWKGTERLNETKKREEKERKKGEWKNGMITKAVQISQTHISSIM